MFFLNVTEKTVRSVSVVMTKSGSKRLQFEFFIGNG